jgi:predicted nucleic acid-binding protein
VRYFDSSALVKLVLDEPESAALIDFVGRSGIISSDLVRTELYRAVVRVKPSRGADVVSLIQQLDLIPLTAEVLDTAGRLTPPSMRSLDALHLASALTIRDELEAFVAYDARLLDAAVALGLPVQSPGRRH